MLLGLGVGFSLTCLVTIVQLSTPPPLIAITSGLIISVRSLGGSVGLAICKYQEASTLKHSLTSQRRCFNLRYRHLQTRRG